MRVERRQVSFPSALIRALNIVQVPQGSRLRLRSRSRRSGEVEACAGNMVAMLARFLRMRKCDTLPHPCDTLSHGVAQRGVVHCWQMEGDAASTLPSLGRVPLQSGDRR